MELRAAEWSVRKHCPPFSDRTSDHPDALLRGNPNQAITTKHESCTKMLEVYGASLATSPSDRDRGEGEEGREEEEMFL